MNLRVSTRSISSFFINVLLFLYIVTEQIYTEMITNTTTNIIATILMVFLLLYAMTNRSFKLYTLTKQLALFTLFCFASILWASHTDWATTRSITMFRLLVLTSLLINYVVSEKKIEILIEMLAWRGSIITVFTILYFGFNRFLLFLGSGYRMDNIINNANSTGIATAISCIISLWFLLYKGRKLHLINIIICVVMTMASGSRTALGALIAGSLVLFAIHNSKKKRFSYLLGVIAVFIVFITVIQLPAFTSMTSRVDALISGFRGTEAHGGSVSDRLYMVQYGIEQFKKTPLLGIGMGCSGDVAALVRSAYSASYLHNNYVDLLVCGGMIGTLLFYSMLITPLVFYIRNFKKRDDYITLGFIVLITYLVLQVGGVIYYSKSTYITMTILHAIVYLEIESLIKTPESGKLQPNGFTTDTEQRV